MGYTGGHKENPTYHNLGNHTETIQMDYDPSIISYDELLEIYWQSHHPVRPAHSTQYQSIIFYHSETQKELAEQTKNALENEMGRTLYTDIRAASRFYLAENYHQKYYLQQHSIISKQYKAIYPNFTDFINSPAITKANGFVGGHGSIDQLNENIDKLGLTDEGQEKIKQMFMVRQ